RHLRAALNKAKRWGYISTVPEFEMEKESEKLVTYITPEHFAKIYQACDVATLPIGQPFSPADWWRALLVMGYLTGWRISELLAVDRQDVDLEKATAITRAEDNKGKRDELMVLRPEIVEHLGRIKTFGPKLFPWAGERTLLYKQFAEIQEAAGIK